jgi:membrane protein
MSSTAAGNDEPTAADSTEQSAAGDSGQRAADSTAQSAAGDSGQRAADSTAQSAAGDSGQKRSGRRPEGPAHARSGSVLQTFKRTVSEFSEDNLTDSAAALTYYAVLSIFPALLALVALVGGADVQGPDRGSD